MKSEIGQIAQRAYILVLCAITYFTLVCRRSHALALSVSMNTAVRGIVIREIMVEALRYRSQQSPPSPSSESPIDNLLFEWVDNLPYPTNFLPGHHPLPGQAYPYQTPPYANIPAPHPPDLFLFQGPNVNPYKCGHRVVRVYCMRCYAWICVACGLLYPCSGWCMLDNMNELRRLISDVIHECLTVLH